ncbi:hypothetical protein [Robiginitomaculum antarcticum]|uniref:hypothetical protein n=1 Tax=Robiginitomaculum antarcticum TaxID=437507 RepID=UPI000377D937|nr:hypothetical protein [Robiginitomaculum antarcticum]
MRFYKLYFTLLATALMTACASTPSPIKGAQQTSAKGPLPASIVVKDASLALPDHNYYHQQDPRWGAHILGPTTTTLSSEGCLVTAAAMALSNLGFATNPGDLNARLTAKNGFTPKGWLIWSGLERVTDGKAKARFFKNGTDKDVRSCLADGYYPLVKFSLASRRSHWVMVVADSPRGFYVRDPMVNMKSPIPLSSRTSGIQSVRCIGIRV